MQSNKVGTFFDNWMDALRSISPRHMAKGDWRHITHTYCRNGIKNSQETYPNGYAGKLKCAIFPFKYLMQPMCTGTRFGRATGKTENGNINLLYLALMGFHDLCKTLFQSSQHRPAPHALFTQQHLRTHQVNQHPLCVGFN